MAKGNLNGLSVRLPFLDRLLDDEPELPRRERLDPMRPIPRDQPISAREALDRVLEAVRRDLQDLLSCRLSWVDDRVASHYEASRSIAAFGMPGFTHTDDPEDYAEKVRSWIENAIAIFEPRLKGVAVAIEPLEPDDRTLRFRIEALLQIEPIREPVKFDTVLQTNGAAEVRTI